MNVWDSELGYLRSLSERGFSYFSSSFRILVTEHTVRYQKEAFRHASKAPKEKAMVIWTRDREFGGMFVRSWLGSEELMLD